MGRPVIGAGDDDMIVYNAKFVVHDASLGGAHLLKMEKYYIWRSYYGLQKSTTASLCEPS